MSSRRWTWRCSSRTTSEPPPERPIFVLDENFPQPILTEALEKWVLEVDLRSIRDYQPRLVGASEDWEVILALRQGGAEALVTCDEHPEECAHATGTERPPGRSGPSRCR